jgi:hypothetical protein
MYPGKVAVKTPKRWRMSRVMLVPGTWQGSVEHFYHFLLGYFMPAVLWQERTGSMNFCVRDCGPMNPWFGLFRPGTNVDTMNAGQMLQRFVTHRQAHVVLRGWDDPRRFHRTSLREFTNTIFSRTETHFSAAAQPRITVVNRKASPAYYLSGESEAYGSGAEWRSIPNIDQVQSILDPLGKVTMLDTASLSPTHQVRALAGTDVLVAQHGAGLSNMIWMQPGSCVVEIQPPQPATVDTIFASLASAKGISYHRVVQESDHAPVDATSVRDAVHAIMAEPTAFIPTMPGSWITRKLRQRPRRL